MRVRFRRRRWSGARLAQILGVFLTLFFAAWGVTLALGTQDVKLWAERMLPSAEPSEVTTGYRGTEAGPRSRGSVQNARALLPFLVSVDVNQELGTELERRTRLYIVWIFGATFQVNSQRL